MSSAAFYMGRQVSGHLESSVPRGSLLRLVFTASALLFLLLLLSCSCNEENADIGHDGDVDKDNGELENPDFDIEAARELDAENDQNNENGKEADKDIATELDRDISEPVDESMEKDDDEPAWTHLLKPGEKRLSTIGLADGLDPLDVNDGYVVWCHGGYGRLFVHKISEGWTKELTIPGVDHLCWYASVDDGKVFTLASSGNSNHKIIVYEIDITNEEYKLIDAGGEAYLLSSIYARNSKIVLEHIESGSNGSKIGLYDREKNKYTIIYESSRAQSSPKINGAYVVWSNMVGNISTEVWLYNINSEIASSLTPTEITDNTYRLFPMMENDLFTWGSSNSSYSIGEIFLLDNSNSKVSILNTENIASHPWLNMLTVLWDEIDWSGIQRVRLYDIEKKIYINITDFTWTGSQSFPKASGRWLAYIDYGRFPLPEDFSGGWDIVLFDLCTLDLYKNDEMCIDTASLK